jgi:Peptidoglycan-binding protein, CsiV
MKRLLLGLVSLVVSWTASADDTSLYKVELIVFENLDPSATQAEDWPLSPGTPSLDNAVELSAIPTMPISRSDNVTTKSSKPPSASIPPPDNVQSVAPVPLPPTPAWQWLDDSALGLTNLVQKLNGSQLYKTIVHVGWIQPVDNSDQGKSVHIYDGMEAKHSAGHMQSSSNSVANVGVNQQTTIPAISDSADNAPVKQDTISPNTEDNTSQLRQSPEQNNEEAAVQTDANETSHILDGTFTLRRGRFLHVDVDLGFTKIDSGGESPQIVDTPSSSQLQTTKLYVRMTQSRRIRNDDLQYLDHPLFGVLFLVSPYQVENTTVPTS